MPRRLLHRHVPAFAAALVAALAGASCGGGETSETERAGATVTRFLSSVADGDDDRACEQLTRRAQQGLAQLLVLLRPDDRSAVGVVTGSQACPHLVATLRSFLKRAGRLDDLRAAVVGVDLRRAGRQATVRMRSARLTTTWPLEKRSGDWRIAEVALGTVKKVEEEGEGD